MAAAHTSKGQGHHPKLQDFFIQAEEHLTDFEENLIKLEALARPDAEILHRLMHTMQTLCIDATSLNLSELAACSRRGEDTMHQVSTGALEVSTTLMNSLFQLGDTLKNLLARYQQGDLPAATPVLEIVKPVKTAKTPAARAFYDNNHLVVEVSGHTAPLGTAEVAVQGDTLTINFPLASSHIQALIAGAGERTFAIPLQHVTEVGKLPADAAADPVFVHQGQTLPLVALTQEAGRYFVILQQGNRKLALAVTTLIGQAEVNPADPTHTLLDVPPLFQDANRGS